jgi:Sulfotransferase domain
MREGLQVIGVGLHRTGSMSLKAALERLGFGPCYHGLEALRRSRDGDQWLAAYEADGCIDWSAFFEGYRSALDWPTVYFWERLLTAFPEAKVVLTVRDLDAWWDSHVKMFQRGLAFDDQLTGAERQRAEAAGFTRVQAVLATVVAAVFDGQMFDRAHSQRVFEAHVARVRGTVPAERLLVYRVQDGWEPLCGFLGVDVPDEPFPRVNVGDRLLDNLRTALDLAGESSADPVWR